MTSHGRYAIFLTGSKRNVERSVYEDEQKRFWIKWYGKYIEVKRSDFGNYWTVEPY